MNKKNDFKRGFDKLLRSTDNNTEAPVKKEIKKNIPIPLTPKHSNASTSKRLKVAKYKELRKCTLYLPPVIMDSLAIMKIRTKRDLSELTADALKEYLIRNNFLDV